MGFNWFTFVGIRYEMSAQNTDTYNFGGMIARLLKNYQFEIPLGAGKGGERGQVKAEMWRKTSQDECEERHSGWAWGEDRFQQTKVQRKNRKPYAQQT